MTAALPFIDELHRVPAKRKDTKHLVHERDRRLAAKMPDKVALLRTKMAALSRADQDYVEKD